MISHPCLMYRVPWTHHLRLVPAGAAAFIALLAACDTPTGPQPNFDHTADQRTADFTVCAEGASGTYNWSEVDKNGGPTGSGGPVTVAEGACVTIRTNPLLDVRIVTVAEASHSSGYHLDHILRDSIVDFTPPVVYTRTITGTNTVTGPIGNDVGIVVEFVYAENFEGCTPGYWKNHPAAWAATGYSSSQTLSSVFSMGSFASLGSTSLLNALSFGGGPTTADKAKILLRAGVAALLDAAHPTLNYPRSPADVISAVNAALASNNATTITNLATALDGDNNAGCPLN